MQRAMKSYIDICEMEVEWYRQHGRFPERIVRDSKGIEYVIGDWSWNYTHDNKKREFIELHLPK